jgi:serine/threonine-protein kinase
MAHVQTVLGQRYEMHEVLGRGAMGTVYRATDGVLERDVAVKLLALDRAEDPTFVARFEREARAVARLSDPRIVMVYDSGHDDGTRYIVMEYVRGMSLAQTIRERGPLEAVRAVEIASQIAGALAAAHRAGIIHRDIKPANVMVDEHGAVKVLDFGIAKAAAGVSLTQTATVLGSAPYLAPEVIRGQPADERSDIYSLGCVLYELVTGRPPFTGEVPAAILHQHDTVEPRPPRARRNGVPDAFDALVMQMLAKDPRARPRSAEALRRALAASVGQPSAPAERTAAMPAAAAATRSLPRARRRFSRGELAALAAGVTLMVAGLVLALTSGSSSSPSHKGARARHAPAARVTRPATRSAAAHAPPARTKARVTEPVHHAAPTGGAASPRTVAGAAGALTTLVTADYEHGSLDQQAAQQILSGLHDVLNAYDSANGNDAVHHTGDLAQHVEQLVSHDDIQPSASPAIMSAVSVLAAAVEQAPPAAPYGLGSGPPAGPKSAGGDHAAGGPKGPEQPKGHNGAGGESD